MLRKIVIILLFSFILVGCIGTAERVILDELEDKYNKVFEAELVEIKRSPTLGNYCKGVFKEPKESLSFSATYYIDASKAYGIKGPLLIDDYLNSRLQKEFATKIKSWYDTPMLVNCKLNFNSYKGIGLAIDDAEKGVNHCINKSHYDCACEIFIFLEDGINTKEVEGTIIENLLKNKLSFLNINFVYTNSSYFGYIENNYIHTIDNLSYLLYEDSNITDIRHYIYSGEKGFEFETVK